MKSSITIQIPLKQPTNRKVERLESVMKRQGEIAETITSLMPSISPNRWSGAKTDNVFHRWVDKKFPDNNDLRSHDANQVAYKVAQNWDTWKTEGYKGTPPSYDAETQVWARFCNCNHRILYTENNGEWGVKLPLEPYNPEWFKAKVGGYQRDLLLKGLNGDASLGDAEVKKIGDDRFVLNQSITKTFQKPKHPPEIFAAVHLGINKIATAVFMDKEGNQVRSPMMFDGSQVAHHRRRLRETRSELQEEGHIDKVREMRDLESRYVEHVNHNISKNIVDAAAELDNAVIVLENLKGIRDQVNEELENTDSRYMLNSWRFHDLQNQLKYKALHRKRILTMEKSPSGISKTCNKCGDEGERPYQERYTRFFCPDCDYEVDAEFNAAMNLGYKAV